MISHSEEFIDLQDLFRSTFLDHRYFVIKFREMWSDFDFRPRAMINVRYRSNFQLLDQVHSNDPSHYSTGYVSYDAGENTVLRSRRCKKFAPFFQKKNIDCLYVIVNRYGEKLEKEDWINVRINTDQGFEFLINHYPVKLNGVSVLEGKKIFDVINGKIDSMATVTLEQPFINMTGNFFIINSNKSLLASDHFTGG